MEGFCIRESEWEKGGGKGDRPLKTERQRQTDTYRERECRECGQKVLLLAAAENVSCQDLKGSLVLMSKY